MTQRKKIPTVAIVGRTNVGKSTLFNALMGRRVAVVEDEPGVTRDRHYGFVNYQGATYTLIDTGGLVGEPDSGLEAEVREQAIFAIEEAELILCVMDAMDGPHPYDKEVIQIIRKSKKEVLWVLNKSEKERAKSAAAEFYEFGIDDLIPVSAAHKDGIKELRRRIADKLGQEIVTELPSLKDKHSKYADTDEEVIVEEPVEKTPIKIAIVGKPNAGKSSLVNRILGEKRLVTSPKAGTTIDSIDISLTRDGQEYTIVDTAGLRKKSNVDDATVERYANIHAIKSLSDADVAILIIDGSTGLISEQDVKIGGLIHERGRAFIIVINKWDIVEKNNKTVKQYEDAIFETFKFARYAPILFVSAETGRRCPQILETVNQVYKTSRTRIKTSELNKALIRAFTRRPPAVFRGQPIKLLFATQVKVQPPEIVLFLNHPDKLGFSYERYIKNELREAFGFEGSEIKLVLRKRERKES